MVIIVKLSAIVGITLRIRNKRNRHILGILGPYSVQWSHHHLSHHNLFVFAKFTLWEIIMALHQARAKMACATCSHFTWLHRQLAT